jgi:hypothetical protein
MLKRLRSPYVYVPLISLAFVYLFFFEYLPPLARVHLYSDIEGYHYPLLHFAFAALKAGHLPLWDPTIYCGLTLIGNVQAAVLYPPNWLMFAANFQQQHLSYMSLQALVMLHLWGAFLFCFFWFRARHLETLASLLGAGVYAFSGYMISQASHVGIATGMMWTPLAMWGIDQAVERHDWRPFWKVAIASAMFFLAGYTPSWLVFVIMVAIYGVVRAGRNWRLMLMTAGALLFSLLLIAVQLLPAMDASNMKIFESHFGNGIQSWEFYLAYFIPNYFDLQRGPGWGHLEGTYLYLGAAFLVGLGWLLIRRNLRAHLPALAIIAGCSFFLANVNGVAWHMVERSRILAQACHSWNFLEGLVLSAALITAVSLDDFLRRGTREETSSISSKLSRPWSRWVMPVAAVALLAWSGRLFMAWLPGGGDFAGRWTSAWDAGAMAVLITLGLLVYRASAGSRRAVIAAVILLAVGMEYKVFGTSRKFSSWDGNVDEQYGWTPFPGVDESVFKQFWANREYRMALDEKAENNPERLRHFGITTPQGFDPLLPAGYRQLIQTYTSFQTNREFFIKPQQDMMLRELAVRYYLTVKGLESYQFMLTSPDFQLLQPYPGENYAVFEYKKAEPPYGFETSSGRSVAGVTRTAWLSGLRKFDASSASGGRFILVEQYFPGWRASVDGAIVPIERWHGAFQAIQMPPGKHEVVFEFRPESLRLGAVISLFSLAGLIALVNVKKGKSGNAYL